MIVKINHTNEALLIDFPSKKKHFELFISTYSIERDIKQVDKKLIEKIWDKEFKLLNPIVAIIETNNKVKMFKYEDIKVLEPVYATENEKKVNKKVVESEEKNITIQKKVNSNNKIKISELEDDDVRKIVIEGMKQGKNNYQALLASGLIVSVEDITGGENI